MREAKTINNITKGSKTIHLFQLVRKNLSWHHSDKISRGHLMQERFLMLHWRQNVFSGKESALSLGGSIKPDHLILTRI